MLFKGTNAIFFVPVDTPAPAFYIKPFDLGLGARKIILEKTF